MNPNGGQPFTRQEIELETKNKTSTQIVIKKPHPLHICWSHVVHVGSFEEVKIH